MQYFQGVNLKKKSKIKESESKKNLNTYLQRPTSWGYLSVVQLFQKRG